MLSTRLQIPKFSLNLSKFLQMKFNSLLFRILPFPLSRRYLIILGSLYYCLNWEEKALIRKTIGHVFQRKFSPPTLKEKIKAAFRGIIDHYHEKLFVGYSNFPKLLKFLKTRIKFAGADQLQEALQEGKGVILVTGHFGAVEFLPGALAVNGYPAAMICRFQTNRLRESLGQRAEAVGLQLIDADEGNIILSAMKALKQGRILITECDEFDQWRPDPDRETNFLQCRLPSDRTLQLLQKRSGAPVVTALMQRQGKKQYTCRLTAIEKETRAATISLHERCLGVLESAVENDPEQWYQWKKFGRMIKAHLKVEDVLPEAEILGPEFELTVAGHA